MLGELVALAGPVDALGEPEPVAEPMDALGEPEPLAEAADTLGEPELLAEPAEALGEPVALLSELADALGELDEVSEIVCDKEGCTRIHAHSRATSARRRAAARIGRSGPARR